jgi:hypothetical protein
MNIVQLNPPIPVFVEGKGIGEAWFLIYNSKEDHIHWVVAIDSTSEIWTVPNPKVRACKNWTLERN